MTVVMSDSMSHNAYSSTKMVIKHLHTIKPFWHKICFIWESNDDTFVKTSIFINRILITKQIKLRNYGKNYRY